MGGYEVEVSKLPEFQVGQEIPPEALHGMVKRGDAERTALAGLGWVLPCHNPGNPGCGEATIVGADRRVKIAANCPLLPLAALIPNQVEYGTAPPHAA